MFTYNCIQQTYGVSRDYWITVLQSTVGTDSITFSDLSLNDADGICTTGYIETSANKDIAFFTLDLYGNVILKKRYTGSGTIDIGNAIDRVPGTSNYAIAGQTNTPGTVTLGNGEVINLLINSISGGILYQNITGSTSYEDATGVKSATYLETKFVVGNRTGATSELLLLSLTSSGAENWRYKINMPDSVLGKNGVALESTWTYFYTACTSTSGVYVFKFDTSGVIQWQTKLEFTGIANKTSIELDSSNNVYVATTLNSTKNYGVLAKFNSAGVLQWQKLIDDGSGPLTTAKIAIRGSDLYYVGTGNSNTVLIKFDLSGNTVWDRNIFGFSAKGLELDSGSNPVMCGSDFDSISDGIVVKLPSSGATTGTYGIFSINDPTMYYYDSIYTVSTPTLSTEVPVLTNDTASLSTSNMSTTDSRTDVI